MKAAKSAEKAPPKRPKPEAVETVPDAMARFTEAMAKVAPPKRPAAK